MVAVPKSAEVRRILDRYLVEFERNCERAGGKVHWARDAAERGYPAAALDRIREATWILPVVAQSSDLALTYSGGGVTCAPQCGQAKDSASSATGALHEGHCSGTSRP